MTPEQALAYIEQERLDVLAEGQTEEDCNRIAAYVLASAYRRLLAARTEALENEWLEDELMEVMRIVAKGMTDTHEDEIIYAMMVTAIRRLMEADTDKYEALFDRWQKRHAAVSPPRESHLCKMLKTGDANDCTCDPIGHPPQHGESK